MCRVIQRFFQECRALLTLKRCAFIHYVYPKWRKYSYSYSSKGVFVSGIKGKQNHLQGLQVLMASSVYLILFNLCNLIRGHIPLKEPKKEEIDDVCNILQKFYFLTNKFTFFNAYIKIFSLFSTILFF